MSRSVALALLLLAGAMAGCESGGGGTAGRAYYGPGWGDPWYYGDHYHYDDVPVTPPPRPDGSPRPDRPPRPAHLPAYGAGRPSQQPGMSATPRAMPSIPSAPRGGGMRGGGRGGRR